MVMRMVPVFAKESSRGLYLYLWGEQLMKHELLLDSTAEGGRVLVRAMGVGRRRNSEKYIEGLSMTAERNQ